MMSSAEMRAMEFLRRQWQISAVEAAHANDDLGAIMNAACSGKWRRSALDDASRLDAESKIRLALSDGRPIEFSIPFGGYKSYRAKSYPHLNWAEVFSVNFLRRYAEAVASSFAGRLLLTFSYCSGVMDIVNNMPLAHQAIYQDEFSALLKLFSDDRIELRLFDVADLFGSIADLREAVLNSAALLESEWSSLPAAVVEKRYSSASRNLQMEGVHCLSSLPPEEQERRITRSAILCEALDSLPQRRQFNKFSTRIQLVHVRGPTPAIHVASCDTSANHFGVGTGVIEVREDRCLQRIVTIGRSEQSESRAIFPTELDENISKGFPGLRVGYFMA